MHHKYKFDIKLKDLWLDFEVQKYMRSKSQYQEALRDLNDVVRKKDKPVVTKIFTMDYDNQDEPKYLATFWKQVDNYIKGMESEGLVYCGIESIYVDMNTDPWDDYKLETLQVSVYAQIKSEEDFTKSKEYQDKLQLVERWYQEMMQYKDRIDERFKEI